MLKNFTNYYYYFFLLVQKQKRVIYFKTKESYPHQMSVFIQFTYYQVYYIWEIESDLKLKIPLKSDPYFLVLIRYLGVILYYFSDYA